MGKAKRSRKGRKTDESEAQNMESAIEAGADAELVLETSESEADDPLEVPPPIDDEMPVDAEPEEGESEPDAIGDGEEVLPSDPGQEEIPVSDAPEDDASLDDNFETVRTNETPLAFYYARRAEGWSIDRLMRYAARDNDDDVAELCRRMEAAENGQTEMTPEAAEAFIVRLDDLLAKLNDCREQTHAITADLMLCRTIRVTRLARMAGSDGTRRPRPAYAGAGNGAVRGMGRLGLRPAAAMLLAETGRAMSAREMVDELVRRGVWSPGLGRTPDATLAAGISTEIKERGDESRFVKTAPGRYRASDAYTEMYRRSSPKLADYENNPAPDESPESTESAEPSEPEEAPDAGENIGSETSAENIE